MYCIFLFHKGKASLINSNNLIFLFYLLGVNLGKMPKLKNLLSIKKRSPSLTKRGQKADQQSHSSNLSLASLPGKRSSSNAILSVSVETLGAYTLKEKDLSKFLKAAWNGDLTKLKQIASKKVNWNECDKQKR